MSRPETLILNHSAIVATLGFERAISAVERVMRAHGQAKVIAPDLLHADVPRGEFHIKTGGELHDAEAGVFGLKANGGFFGNAERGLPNIVGVIYLADAQTGCPLAVLDSVEISRVRTGAATAVAARHLARPESEVVTVVGTGTQALTQVEALKYVLPLKRVQLVGRDPVRTHERALAFERALALDVAPYGSVHEAMKGADVLVTCTPARGPLVSLDDVHPGLFIAAVGADSPGKQELESRLTASCTAVADIHHQSVSVGELQHPIGQGLMDASQVHAEIGQVLTGARSGRTNAEEIMLYDSTGTALQDVAVGFEVYKAAREQSLGQLVQLGS